MDKPPSEDDEEIPFPEEDSASEEDEDPLAEDEENHLWAPHSNGEGSAETLVAAHTVPLTLVVEIGRLQMPLDKLLQLQPGNVLELPIHPEEGVYLVLNGKKVAKGELIKLGELLGVKILSTP
jgi:flagellar motor switch protein FliN